MEDITEADYAKAKRVYKDFRIKNLDEYHDLYLQSDKLLLANIFYFWNRCFEIRGIDLAHFPSVQDYHSKRSHKRQR